MARSRKNSNTNGAGALIALVGFVISVLGLMGPIAIFAWWLYTEGKIRRLTHEIDCDPGQVKEALLELKKARDRTLEEGQAQGLRMTSAGAFDARFADSRDLAARLQYVNDKADELFPLVGPIARRSGARLGLVAWPASLAATIAFLPGLIGSLASIVAVLRITDDAMILRMIAASAIASFATIFFILLRTEIKQSDLDPVGSEGLVYHLFTGPGRVFTWWAYHFPARGEVLASGRRRRSTVVHVVLSLAFYTALVLVGLRQISLPTPGRVAPTIDGAQVAEAAAAPALQQRQETPEASETTLPGFEVSRPPETAHLEAEGDASQLAVEPANAVSPPTPDTEPAVRASLMKALKSGKATAWKVDGRSGYAVVSDLQRYPDRECRSYQISVRSRDAEQLTSPAVACILTGEDWQLAAQP